MASYLFPYQSVQYEPYQAPVELYGQALAYKNAKFAQGLANIRSHYDQVLSTPLTNEQNQIAVRQGIQDAMNRLSKAAVSDVSLPENQASINSVFDNILNDRDIMYDAAWTQHHNGEISKAEALQKTKPELVPPQNLEPLYLASEAYRSGDRKDRPRPTSFQPFHDFNTKMSDFLDKVKVDTDVMFAHSETEVEGPDGKMHKVGFDAQYTVEQLKGYTIQKLVNDKLMSDPQALSQMKLDYDYNVRNGFYPASNAISEINTELEGYRSMDKALQTAIDSGVNLNHTTLTANEKEMYEKQRKGVAGEISRLIDMQNKIKITPEAANEYFTFGKHASKYVSSLVEQRAYSKTSTYSELPYVAALQKYRYDDWLAQRQYLRDASLEGIKSANKVKEAKAAEGEPIVPLRQIIKDLDANKAGINISNEAVAGLGNMEVDKDGQLWRDWTGTGDSPETTLIVTPGATSMTREQIHAIDKNTIYKKMENELTRLSIPGTGTVRGVGSVGAGAPVDASEQQGVIALPGSVILQNYRQDPNSIDDKSKAIIAKYKPLLGFDPNDKDDRGQYKADQLKLQLEDPVIAESVEYGLTTPITGRMKFVPDPGKNLVASADGSIMYIKGRGVMPKSKAALHMGENGVMKGLKKNYVLNFTTEVTPGEAGTEKKGTTVEDMVGVSMYMPVYSNPTTINDRLLKTMGYQSQWGTKAPEKRQESAQELNKFMNLVDLSKQLPSGDGALIQNSDGSYSLDNVIRKPGGVDISRSRSEVIELASGIATRTGIPYNEVLSGVANVLGRSGSSLQRMEGLMQFESSVGSQAPDMNSRAARNNNPLNIKDNAVGNIYSTGKDNENHAVFGSISDGLQAGYIKLQNIQQGLSGNKDYKADATIPEFASVYAESPNDAANLIASLRLLGFNATETTKINQIPLPVFYEAMIMKEDRRYYNYLKSSGILDEFLKRI